MDEGARKKGPTVSDQSERGTEEIRANIEEAREELGATVEELAGRTDVKARTQAKAEEVKAKTEEVKESVRQGNPALVALAGAFVAGVVVGRVLSR
jgi:F0F1-type ATP synthase assembly protein I